MGVDSDFSVKLWSKNKSFVLLTWTWTKLNKSPSISEQAHPIGGWEGSNRANIILIGSNRANIILLPQTKYVVPHHTCCLQ